MHNYRSLGCAKKILGSIVDENTSEWVDESMIKGCVSRRAKILQAGAYARKLGNSAYGYTRNLDRDTTMAASLGALSLCISDER